MLFVVGYFYDLRAKFLKHCSEWTECVPCKGENSLSPLKWVEKSFYWYFSLWLFISININ